MIYDILEKVPPKGSEQRYDPNNFDPSYDYGGKFILLRFLFKEKRSVTSKRLKTKFKFKDGAMTHGRIHIPGLCRITTRMARTRANVGRRSTWARASINPIFLNKINSTTIYPQGKATRKTRDFRPQIVLQVSCNHFLN